MEKIYRLAKELQSKRDALDEQRDKELREIEPLKKYSLKHNADSIRRMARAKLRSRGVTDTETQCEVLELLSGLDIPDVYTERVQEVKKRYSDSLGALERGYRPLFQNELNAIAAAVGRIKPEQETDTLLDEKTMQAIQLLALRKDTVSRAELDSFADMAKGNLSALTLLDQIAERSTPQDMYGRRTPSHRYRGMYVQKQSRKEKAENAARQLAAGVSNYLNNHSDRASRIAQEHYNLTHGTEINSARWAFSDMDTFYNRIEVDADSMEILGTLVE